MKNTDESDILIKKVYSIFKSWISVVIYPFKELLRVTLFSTC
jgi:hypothetical protein